MSKEKQIWEQPGYDFDPPYPASTPVITNYDRLISKAPEEMATWLSAIMGCGYCPTREHCDEVIQTQFCKEILLDWLKSPVEEET